ncbi:MAG TPA: isoprenylcysteine carboxylmethyltransferase family protein [Clostridia bacterium]|jgi:protein-S-isoprenylcysteine O-methyltransferase Ste14|nr:isoprenylcysteine carboxylmethyltransferase family protein [Clostridiaceae bacterium]HOF27550.1 isoprenylcysteine carboxylmethyltransferase family protein [Clostridia bacterium]HPD01064.1 isoprenylcysteine carboxylmethyltransferase family protein [Acetivibrio sp.]HOM34384.1 isoprenylcysteine carboxylmethyltransferase family protein [Clostridia bacterium]HOT71270.1 isoprenylcysteine carboxylmethyltransferase family protein [Clostridia bacterium]
MTKKLFFQAIGKFVFGLVFVALLLFLPAGTLRFWNGWLFIGILFLPISITGIVMMIRNPELLKKRLNAKEKQKEQKTVIFLSGLMFVAAFIVAGLNFRFSWIVLPDWLVYTASGIFVAAYLMYVEVLRENEYLSRTVEVQKNQKVIDTGLYGIVRHPMYFATLFLFLSMGLVLGSPISFVIMLFYIPIIVKRINNEEKILAQGLEGYEEYRKKVKYRIIPFIW